ncbi:MAG: hypothetical protein WEE64_01810 [Dehalococcoidia bacterium]
MTAESAEVERKAPRRRSTGGGRAALAKNFYRSALEAAEQIELDEASDIERLDDEIALLRVRLRKVVDEKREDIPLMLRGIDMLVKAVSARYRLSKQAEEDLAASLASVVRGVGGQLMPEAFRDE